MWTQDNQRLRAQLEALEGDADDQQVLEELHGLEAEERIVQQKVILDMPLLAGRAHGNFETLAMLVFDICLDTAEKLSL